MKIESCKVTDGQGEMNSSPESLRREVIDPYAGIRCSVDQSLVEISKRLIEMFGLEAMALQQSVHDALRSAVGGVKKSFDDVSKVVDRSLSLIVGHQKRDVSTKPGSPSAHSANCEPRRSQTSAASEKERVSMSNKNRSSAPAFPGATDSCSYFG